MRIITKVLSKNDVSETRAHQAGMYILKNQVNFFPKLSEDKKNPRVTLNFEDECGEVWSFDFIHYNNKYFTEKGERDEYRLTPMNKYFEQFNIKAGDTITLLHEESKLKIVCERTKQE
ncbi:MULTISPECIES: EcoRII N-terminal effector-binding domain-containing protein [unclassified Paenibacillus]|uniref:EcoRII N-terminal effector-binding domain-containing protein n=1 Tax=unclassified Paenibacillus TaxID=185978 RepID=UPI002788D87D|nr:EcoRII N-terminal effector-binding domain-containing protein [Paenibacillus sp. W2I17]MDQ0658391.1 hypothetical protein [Paenibacillus sp. W2I17]